MKPWILLLFLFVASLSHSAITKEHSSGAFNHVVLIWLKDPGNQQAIDQITTASQSFSAIPGVLAVKVGRAANSDRPIVDDSFDVGIIISFPDKQTMEAYLMHPIHTRAVHDTIKPLVKRITVYDIR